MLIDDITADPDVAQGEPDSELPDEEAAGVDAPTRSAFAGALNRLPDATTAAGLVVAIVCSLFVLAQMRPDLIFSDTTPAGGDMGAHVWGPAYMRDNLLTNGRLTGWTPDWYAGFPAYQYYMVVPALAIIAVNAGISPLLGIPLAIGIIAAGVVLARREKLARIIGHKVIIGLAVLAAVLVVGLPYGVAFKLVSVSGIVLMPLAAYAMGRMLRSPEPVPALLACGTTVFLFDTNFTIYGGNVASTLAGEFSFSISLCLSLLAIGLVGRGMDNGKGRAVAAVIVGLVALTHIIPLFFTIAALVLLVLLTPELPRTWTLAAAITMSLIPLGFAEGSSLGIQLASLGSFLIVAVAMVLAEPRVRSRATWLIVVGPTAALLSMFWLAPFYLRSEYFNDMGWERRTDIADGLLTTPMIVALPIAAVGAIMSFAIRDRIGILFTVLGLGFAAAYANMPDSKLWNARLLPFYYLSVFLVAAVAIALIARFCGAAISERFDQPHRSVLVGFSLAGLVAAMLIAAIPLRVVPFARVNDQGDYAFLGFSTSADSFIDSWVSWNYSGYEEKRSYREYSDVVNTMDEIGENNGCGRAMWEYNKHLDQYGTPMALMLLPHWTDGCIGSMEGLYFESSATTPFHFLNQSNLSVEPSRAQRDLPYKSFSIDRGVAELQVMGVRYYMALTDEAIEAARGHRDLTELAVSEPFVIFEVAGSEQIEGLAFEPVVASGPESIDDADLATRFEQGWLSQAVEFYNDPQQYQAMPAEDGPAEWQRVGSLLPSDGITIDPVTVSEIETGTDSIAFTVDEIGKPVLVKTSYFPNWSADGADGPYRIGPNLMVVVPTDTSVELSYGKTWVDRLGTLLTLIAIAGLFALRRLDRLAPNPL